MNLDRDYLEKLGMMMLVTTPAALVLGLLVALFSKSLAALIVIASAISLLGSLICLMLAIWAE